MELKIPKHKVLRPKIMIKKVGFTAAYAAIVLLVMGITQTAHALRTSLGAAVGVGYTDNIQRVATNKEDEYTRIGMIGLSLAEDSESVTADVAATLRHEDFIKDTSNDRFLFGLASRAEWKISPDRLSWTITDNFTQARVDSVDPSTPDNTQDSNVFSTGPDAFFRFGTVNRLELGARYIDTRFEVSTSNSKRYTIFAGWLYTPTSARELSLNVDAAKVQFEGTSSDSDFISVDYSLAFLTRTSQSSLRYEIGFTTVKRDELEDFNGLLMGLQWSWSPTRQSTFDLSATSGITDSGRSLLTADSGTNTDADKNILDTEQIASDVFRETKVQLGYIRSGYNYSAGLSVFWVDRDYKTAPLDREVSGALASYSYNLTVPLVLSVSTQYQHTIVFATGRKDDSLSFSAGLGYHFRRNLTFELNAAYLERDSNQIGSDFDAFSAFLGVTYGF